MEYRFASRMQNLKASAIREILKFTSDPSVISFAAGNPAPEAFPVEPIREISADILQNNPIGALQYGVSEGYAPLRDVIRADLKKRLAIGREFDDVIITSGGEQASELTCKAFCDPGDVVLCENPSFIGCLNAFRSYEVKLAGIEVEDDGISIEQLRKNLEAYPDAKFLYVIPNFQNPSGVTMSLQKRKAVYELCVKYGVLIIEDNPYGELRFAGESLPSIKSMDTEGIVVYCGSFSKVISPGLRVGFLCAPKEIITKAVIGKQCTDVHTNMFAQMICHEFITKYDFSAHLKKLPEIYRHKSGLMLSEMKKNLNPKITYVEPEGGLFIWCRLPEGVDMMEFCTNAVKHKVALVPGTAFNADEEAPSQCFRMNYSTPTDGQIVEGIKILGELSKNI